MKIIKVIKNKIQSIVDKHIEEQFKKDPEYVFNRFPVWCWDNKLNWIAFNKVDYFYKRDPKLLFKYNPEWMIKNHLDYLIDNQFSLLESIFPDVALHKSSETKIKIMQIIEKTKSIKEENYIDTLSENDRTRCSLLGTYRGN